MHIGTVFINLSLVVSISSLICFVINIDDKKNLRKIALLLFYISGAFIVFASIVLLNSLKAWLTKKIKTLPPGTSTSAVTVNISIPGWD